MTVASPETGCSAAFRQRYVDNLGHLYRVDPALAEQVDALPFGQLPVLEPTRDGNVTVQVPADDGKSIYLHSRYRPVEEARELVAQQLLRTRGDDADLADLEHNCFVVTGIGLGYHVAELERRFTKPFCIVAEPDLRLLKLACCVCDFTALLRDRRVTFITDVNKAAVHERLRPIITLIMLGLNFLRPAAARRCGAAFYVQVSTLLRDFVAFARIQTISVVRNARRMCRNCAFNLPAYVGQPGVEVLTGKAAGFPAIVVAAGPSLARNVEQLGPLRDRAVIIAVQTVLKTLLARGIRPHFVTSLDYHEISGEFFRGLEGFGDTVLVAEPKVTWRVPDLFKGRMHLLHSGFVDDLLREAAPQRERLRAGSTVAHLAFYLAEHLGCDPVILVGQDLSFTEGLYYPPGMQIERIWAPELGRFQTIEMKQWERIVRARGGLKVVKDIHGRDTYTDDQLFTYAEQFQSDFLSTRTHVIHATEGGMRLAGTDVMRLAEAAARYCTRPLPPGLLDVPQAPSPDAAMRRVLDAIEARITELCALRQHAATIHGLLEQLDGLTDQPAAFNRIVRQINGLRGHIQESDRTYSLVSQVSQLAELRRIQADRGIDDQAEETPATARRRLRRDRDYVSAFLDGIDFLLQMLPEAAQRVRERLG